MLLQIVYEFLAEKDFCSTVFIVLLSLCVFLSLKQILLFLNTSYVYPIGRVPVPMLPWGLPLLGHSLAFMRNSEAFLTYGRQFFGNTRNIFAVRLGRNVFYVLTNPKHVTTLYKETEKLPFDHFVETTIRGFGLSQDGVRKLFDKPQDGARKSIVWRAHDLQAQQTKGYDLEQLSAHIAEFFQNSIRLEHNVLQHFSRLKKQNIECWSLKRWTTDIVIHAIQDVYFGKLLAQIDPELPHVVAEFDDLSYQAWYRYPRLFTPTLNRLQRRIQDGLENYFKTAQNQRDCKAWFTTALEKECLEAGLSNSDLISMMLFMYWGITTNTSKVAYWIIAHTIFDPKLAEIIQTETAPAFQSNDTIDTEYLVKKCPRLNSIWLETLRLSASSTAVRYIFEDTQIGDTVLPKGDSILYSARQLHLDNNAFGSQPNEFDPWRFVRRPGLKRDPSYRPFGGGPTLCPGRHLAKHVVLTFVALALRRYDFSLAFDQAFPRYKECKPAIGVMGGCDDLYFTIKPRSN